MKRNKGFTLIELLVVIAIIGILASVVLSSLSTARDGGEDAANKANANNARAQAELFRDGNGASGYDGVCTAATGTLNMVNAIAETTTVQCGDDADGWAIGVELNAGGFFCVDSSGLATTTATTVTTNPVSGATDPSC